MKTLFAVHPWMLVETRLHRDDMRLSESLTSIGNAHMGIRGSFEEAYSGDCHRGTYLAGVWHPERARTDWRKVGYPPYYGRMPGAPGLIEIGVAVDGEDVDLYANEVASFSRVLDMEHGLLSRRATVRLARGRVSIETTRFVSITRKELLAIRYAVTPAFDAEVVLTPALDARARGGACGETVWEAAGQGEADGADWLMVRTRENPFGAPRFTVTAAMRVAGGTHYSEPGRVQRTIRHRLRAGETATLCKYVCVDTSRDHDDDGLLREHVLWAARDAERAGFERLEAEQAQAWRERWNHMDVVIEGDDSAQQGIRFNLFELLCTYDGKDPRL
ncbi:glycoside hydrolase family 65 protein, partial [Eubacteriales bacterium OttesenSCG-928-A19]|nr:glycoside hydrolase family 65 protein [Eubacteriales bacterium OttesenSCG-928-A19]